MVAGKWALRVARDGVAVPVPQRVLDRLAADLGDDSVRKLQVRAEGDRHLVLSGRKRVGVWLDFRATFRLEPPSGDDPPRAIVLVPEKVQPLPARSLTLAAMAALPAIERDGDRLALDLDRLMEAHEWGRRVPGAVRDRVRVAGVRVEDGRIRLRLAFSRDTA